MSTTAMPGDADGRHARATRPAGDATCRNASAARRVAAARPDAAADPGAEPERNVLVLASLSRDAELLVEALAAADIAARRVSGPAEFLAEVGAEVDGASASRLGVLLVTDDALGTDWSQRLVEALDRQPPWSDLPIVLLADGHTTRSDPGWSGAWPAPVAERLMQRGSVTVLDRPLRAAALVSAVRAALRARSRQVEVQQLIEARDRALAEADRANRAKGDFLAVMSHELRTPLNAIGGYVQLIDMGIHGPLTPEQKQAIERIDHAQRYLLSIINGLLDYARVEAGTVEYRLGNVAVQDIVSEVGMIMEPQFAARQLRYDTRLPDAPLLASADAEKLQQVLINLLSNAVKFTPSGGAITVAAEADEDGSVRIVVTDTGVGIPDDRLEAIFEPFVQVHEERRSGGPRGTGLGLAISRELARGMGGELRAASRVGHGTTFTLLLRGVAQPAADITSFPAA